MSDPYSQYVAVLLHMDGTNGGTTFTDTSLFASPFTHAFSGETSTAEALFGTASFTGQAGGGACYLTFSDSNKPQFQIQPGQDFTIEAAFWCASVSVSDPACLFSLSRQTVSFGYPDSVIMYVEQITGFLRAKCTSGVGNVAATTMFDIHGNANLCDGAWHRCAFVRQGVKYSLYVDGVQVASVINTDTVGVTDVSVSIGMTTPGGSNGFIMRDGFIDEVRFTNGVARYAGATYTPDVAAFPDPTPDTCDPYFSDVSLLLHFEGNTTDSSSHANTMTATNMDGTGTGIVGANSSHNSGSAYSASLFTPVTSLFDFQNVDTTSFTVEFWYRPSAGDISNPFAVQLFDLTSGGTSGFMVLKTAASTLLVQVFGTGGAGQPSNLTDSTVMVAGGLYHIAVVMDVGTQRWRVYVNGICDVAGAGSASNVNVPFASPFSGNVYIGGAYNSGVNGQASTGNVDEVRVTKGVARYTNDFVMSPIAFPDIACSPPPDCDPNFTDVSLLLHFDGDFTDTGPVGHTMTPTNFDALGEPLFGSHSMRNIGTYSNCSLTTPIDTSLDLQAADITSFTVEFWYNPSEADVSHSYPPVLVDFTNNATTGFYIQMTNDPHFSIAVYGTSGSPQPIPLADSRTPIPGVWYHIAAVMDATAHTWTLYVNGASTTGPQTVSAAWPVPFGGNLRIGGSFGVGPTGRIEDLRITKDVARYTDDFIIPTAAFPDIACSVPPPVGTVFVYGKFVPSSDYKAIEMDRLGTIKPRIYAPVPNRTVRSKP